ncbi:hypothetical protein M0802_012855 [Mischocyttarus mexicanus]|nr:hypothetical protein M0802_012855 [Mischocyttarus mexicanus]
MSNTKVLQLKCQVSWMRKRDMHILSAGILMYTSDLRFQVIHPDKSENWTLQIKSPQERDSGVYECQVSTEPKMSLNYTLNVIEYTNIHRQHCITYVNTCRKSEYEEEEEDNDNDNDSDDGCGLVHACLGNTRC